MLPGCPGGKTIGSSAEKTKRKDNKSKVMLENAALRSRFRIVQNFADLQRQLFRGEGFLEKGCLGIDRFTVTGNVKDFHRGAMRQHVLGQFPPTHTRHHYICDQ